MVQRHARSAAFRRLRVERELPARVEPYPCPCWPGRLLLLAEAAPHRCAGSSSYIRWYHTGMEAITISRTPPVRRCKADSIRTGSAFSVCGSIAPPRLPGHPRSRLRVLFLAVMLPSCATAPTSSVESVESPESPADCRVDADCRLHRVFTCAEIRGCSSVCPGAGHLVSLPVKTPAPAAPACGPQPPCTPSCPMLSPLSPGSATPHAGCRDLRCVVLPEGASR